jgi:hypothetical protein
MAGDGGQPAGASDMSPAHCGIYDIGPSRRWMTMNSRHLDILVANGPTIICAPMRLFPVTVAVIGSRMLSRADIISPIT